MGSIIGLNCSDKLYEELVLQILGTHYSKQNPFPAIRVMSIEKEMSPCTVYMTYKRLLNDGYLRKIGRRYYIEKESKIIQ